MITGNDCKINKLYIKKLIIDANFFIQSEISLLDNQEKEIANISNIVIPSKETLNKIEELFKCIELDAAKEVFNDYESIEQDLPNYKVTNEADLSGEKTWWELEGI
jgi:hypothetical protein